MAAEVVMGAQAPRTIAQHNHAIMAALEQDIAAALWQIADMARQQPTRAKNTLLFNTPDVSAGEIPLIQRALTAGRA
jgi:hypothetical protein